MLSPHFSREEFACKCNCGFDTVDSQLLTMLEVIRQYFDSPVTITSGCRCLEHNTNIGGSVHSQHLLGRAADIQVRDIDPATVQDFVDRTWPDEFGMGRADTFTHIDSRDHLARWNYDS